MAEERPKKVQIIPETRQRITFSTMEESLAEVLKDMGEGQPRVLADITKQEHAALCVGYAFENAFPNPVLKEFLDKILTLSPARGGRRAKQLADIGVASMRGAQEQRGGLVPWMRRQLGLTPD
jgi:hypothetical protein